MPDLEYVLDRPETTLGGAIADGSATSVTLATGGAAALGPPVANSLILIGSEIIKVASVAGDVLTVTGGRAQSGTTAAAHVIGAKVYLLKESTVNTGGGALAAGATSIALATGGGAALGGGTGPTAPFFILIDSEVIEVTAITSDSLGTVAVSYTHLTLPTKA